MACVPLRCLAAPRRADGARARARARCGRAHVRAFVERAGEFGRGTRAARAESRGHFR